MSKQKFKLEADLDPPGTTRTRPGGTAAARVLEATKGGRKVRDKSAGSKATTKTRRHGFAALEADLDPPDTPRTRPGGFAAARAVAASKPRPGAKKR